MSSADANKPTPKKAGKRKTDHAEMNDANPAPLQVAKSEPIVDVSASRRYPFDDIVVANLSLKSEGGHAFAEAKFTLVDEKGNPVQFVAPPGICSGEKMNGLGMNAFGEKEGHISYNLLKKRKRFLNQTLGMLPPHLKSGREEVEQRFIRKFYEIIEHVKNLLLKQPTVREGVYESTRQAKILDARKYKTDPVIAEQMAKDAAREAFFAGLKQPIFTIPTKLDDDDIPVHDNDGIWNLDLHYEIDAFQDRKILVDGKRTKVPGKHEDSEILERKFEKRFDPTHEEIEYVLKEYPNLELRPVKYVRLTPTGRHELGVRELEKNLAHRVIELNTLFTVPFKIVVESGKKKNAKNDKGEDIVVPGYFKIKTEMVPWEPIITIHASAKQVGSVFTDAFNGDGGAEDAGIYEDYGAAPLPVDDDEVGGDFGAFD